MIFHKPLLKAPKPLLFRCVRVQREFWIELFERIRRGEDPCKITTMKIVELENGEKIIIVE